MKPAILFNFILLLITLSCETKKELKTVSGIKQTPSGILSNLLNGNLDSASGIIKWAATEGDIIEYNGQLIDSQYLYSSIDTVFTIKRNNETEYLAVFSTAPMTKDDMGKMVSASDCHVCGLKIGYFTYTIVNDSLQIQTFRKNFATHGTFGEKSYLVSFVNLGDGYEILKIDDPYNGMGISTVTTKFYMSGELLLSMISREDNAGNYDSTQKGYYEFKTDFAYNPSKHTININQTGFKIDEISGKRKSILKRKELPFDQYSLSF